MCGLAGLFGSLGIERTREFVERMLHVQSHRGPDSSGVWFGTIKGVHIGVGFRRLKILDLSDAADQPMVSDDGRFVLVFNGEIYNYIELRDELAAAGAQFRTDGDTEVLLQALIFWGPAAFERLNGMWALAFLDCLEGKVLLSRDRFGVKPLYTYIDERGLFVSSEIKAILDVTDRKFRVNASTANAYLCQSILCASPATFLSGVEEFPAGHFAHVAVKDLWKNSLNTQRYWAIPTESPERLNESELIEVVRQVFIDSVKLRL